MLEEGVLRKLFYQGDDIYLEDFLVNRVFETEIDTTQIIR